MENFNASYVPANDAELIAVPADGGSALAVDQVPVEALTPAAPNAPAEPALKTASLSLAAAKSRAAKADAENVTEQAEVQAETQAAAPPAPVEEVLEDEGKPEDGEGEKDADPAGVNGVLIAAGGLLGLGLIGAAVASGGGGGGDEDDEPAPPANRPPVATADVASATEGGAIVSGSVATNDSDPDGNSLSFSLATPVAGLVLNGDGSYTFDASNPAYNDLDSGESRVVVANYTASDGLGGSVSSTLTITVTGANDAPVAVADSFATNEDTALVIAAPGVLGNDGDADGEALTAVLVSGPTNGTLTLDANGSFTYTPNANYSGADSFTYKPNDGTTDGAPVTVSLTVNPVNDLPVAVADSFATNEDTALVITAPGVLANDGDADSDALTSVLVSGPTNGTLTLNANGSFTYTPTANYTGADSFTYKPNDGTTDGAPVTVSLTVNPVNDVPVAVADSFITNEDTALVIAAPGVLGNDGDVDGDEIGRAHV